MPHTINDRDPESSHLMRLRALMPRRPLSFDEALQRAELQAVRLLELADITDAPVPDSVITDQARVLAELTPLTSSSGISRWEEGAWRIRLNAYEPPVRRRFTLAHEYKHILDAPLEAVAYERLRSVGDHHPRIEQVCDYFAASLLMPKKLVKRAWFSGLHDPVELAELFDVSPQAMNIRLRTLGLKEQPLRCPPTPLRRASGTATGPAPRPRSFRRRLSTPFVGAV